MKNLLTITYLVIVAITFSGFKTAASNNEVVGNWKYEVPTAPVGYDKGVMVISEKEGKLVGEVKFVDGYKIDLKEVSYENGVLKCGLYVDYNYVSITAKIEGSKMAGNVNTPEGEMKITAEKEQ